jgi:alkylation response protein AidB-like acyl-CoA dehydrogenase
VIEEARRLAQGTWSTAAARRSPDGVDGWWATIDGLGWVDADTQSVVTLAVELGRVLAPGRFASAVLGRAAGGATTVALDGDVRVDGRRLTGTARWVPDLAAATSVAVAAGDAVFVVDVDAAGVTSAPIEPIDHTRSFGTLVLDHVDGEEVGPAPAARDLWALLLAADAAGVAAEALARTVAHAKNRVQFGKPIGSFQAVKHRCADMHLLVEGSLAAVRTAAATLDPRAVSVAKSYAGDAAARVTADAIQLHGGIGYTWEHDCHLFLKRARLDQALGGDSRWHRRRLARRYA